MKRLSQARPMSKMEIEEHLKLYQAPVALTDNPKSWEERWYQLTGVRPPKGITITGKPKRPKK